MTPTPPCSHKAMIEMARVAKLVGDPTRAGLVLAMADGPIGLAELVGCVGLTEGAVKQHLQLLSVAGMLVTSPTRPRAYSLTESGQNVRRFIERLGSIPRFRPAEGVAS